MTDILSMPLLLALGYLLSALALRLLSERGLADWRAAHAEQRPVRPMTFWSPLIQDAWRDADGIPCRLPDAQDMRYRDLASAIPLLNTMMLFSLVMGGVNSWLARTFLPGTVTRP